MKMNASNNKPKEFYRYELRDISYYDSPYKELLRLGILTKETKDNLCEIDPEKRTVSIRDWKRM
jgi:hypothetical protein